MPARKKRLSLAEVEAAVRIFEFFVSANQARVPMLTSPYTTCHPERSARRLFLFRE
jgi:hypothetical protein